MRRITFFVVQTRLPGNAPITLLHTDEFNELFIGPHVRLASYDGMACIETESLAQQYAGGCSAIMQKCYGSNTKLEVIPCEEIGGKKLTDRISRDSAIVRMRIATGNFVPNKIRHWKLRQKKAYKRALLQLGNFSGGFVQNIRFGRA